MNTVFSASDGNNNVNLNQGHEDDAIMFELSNNNIGTKIFNLTNELNSRGILFSFWITKKRKYLIIYKINQISINKEALENLLKHIISTYSLRIETNLDNFFIPDIKKIEQASFINQQEMERQFQYDMQLKQMEMQVVNQKETFIEDRKDKRTKIQATQQSEMISQRKNDGLPIDFENEPDQGLGAFM